jgi:hypothetical protein
MDRLPIAERIPTVEPWRPRPDAIVSGGEGEAIALIRRAEADSQARAAKEDKPVLAGAALATDQTEGMALILRESRFFTQHEINDTLAWNGSQQARIDSDTRNALRRIGGFFVSATAIVLRVMRGRYSPGILSEARAVALRQEPTYLAARAGMRAAQETLARSADSVPAEPAWPRKPDPT